jgi:hypothetical protein
MFAQQQRLAIGARRDFRKSEALLKRALLVEYASLAWIGNAFIVE